MRACKTLWVFAGRILRPRNISSPSPWLLFILCIYLFHSLLFRFMNFKRMVEACNDLIVQSDKEDSWTPSFLMSHKGKRSGSHSPHFACVVTTILNNSYHHYENEKWCNSSPRLSSSLPSSPQIFYFSFFNHISFLPQRDLSSQSFLFLPFPSPPNRQKILTSLSLL